MNLLHDENLPVNAVVKTAQTRKLSIDGHTDVYPVFKINLDLLFYNDKNDRIATWMSQYKAQHNGKAPSYENKDTYNELIEKFIVESNPVAINKTQTNIEMIDQREAGVVLSDGRIIDGNRRFTCLRRLAKKSDRFKYFEAVILDRNIETNAKQIKMLELSIQHGEESKVDYNTVDRLVGIYNDIILTSLLSIEEYARSTDESVNEVKKRVEVANLMVEFLNFINAPEQFHIARDLEICFPLEELLKLCKKCKTEDEIEDLKNIAFTNILMQTSSDMGRFIRNIKPLIGSECQDEFFEEQKNTAAKIIDSLPTSKKITTSIIREVIRSDAEMAQELRRSMDKALTKARKNETRNKPIQIVEKAIDHLETIDTNILLKMNTTEKQRFIQEVDKLEQVLTSIREKCNVDTYL